MANKIYTTLANLYNEVKLARKDKASLVDAIDDSIKNQQEVLDARGLFPDLKSRFDDVIDRLSIVDVKYGELKADILNHAIAPPTPTAPVVNIDGKELLVSLENKISYKEDILTIRPNEQRILKSLGKNDIYDAYMRTANTTTLVEPFDFCNTNIEYDSTRNTLTGTNIVPTPTGNLYKIPLHLSKIFNMDQLDAAILPNICSITTDYSTPTTNADGSLNYSNHLINSLRGNADWVAARSFLTVVVIFDRPTPVIKFKCRQKSNSSICSLAIEVSNDNMNWTRVYNGNENSADVILPNSITTKYVRYIYNCYDNTNINYCFNISEISMFATEYPSDSGVIETIEPIPIYERDCSLKIATTGATDNVNHVVTKFAISNVNENNGKWCTYIPKNYTVLPRDFYDNDGMRYTGDALKNNYKVDYANNIILETKAAIHYTLSTIAYGYGDVYLNAGNDYTTSSALKVNEAAFMKAYIKIDGVDYTIPLHPNNINKELPVTIGTTNLILELSILNNNVMKVFVRSDDAGKTVRVDEIRVELTGADWFGTRYFYQFWAPNQAMGNNSYVNISRIDSIIKGVELSAFDMSGLYQTYTVNWRWGWHSTDENISISASSAIVPKKYNTSNFSTSSVTQSIANERDANIVTVKNTNCELPVNIYLANTDYNTLLNTIDTDTIYTSRNTTDPIFSYKKEFVTKVFVGKTGRVSKIFVDQEVHQNDEIQYAISYDSLSYYIFDKDALEWKTHYDVGMNGIDIAVANETFYDKLKCSEWLYIKVIIDSPNAKLNSITVQFVDDMFVLIDKLDIYDKGMYKRHLEAIDPVSLTNFLVSDYAILKLASIAKTISPMYTYRLSGYKIQDFNDVQWVRLDPLKVQECLLPNNSLLYKNISTTNQDIKVVRRLIENQVAVINSLEDDKILIKEISDKEIQLEDKVSLLQQSLEVMHQSMSDGTTPPDLPTALLPDVKELDIPMLHQNESYTIANMAALRGLQIWQEQTGYHQYSTKLLYDVVHEADYFNNGIVVKSTGAEVKTDFDRDSPYLVPNTGNVNSATKMTCSYYDLTINEVPAVGAINNILLDDGSISDTNYGFYFGRNFGYPSAWAWSWRSTKFDPSWASTVRWDLPGENRRWVDIIIDFRTLTYVNSLNNVTFGIQNYMNAFGYLYYDNQITTFSYSKDGLEYTDLTHYTGGCGGTTIAVNKELRYLRIRLENPYSIGKGAGTVSFTEMSIYFSKLRYDHDEEFYIYNKEPIDTSDWTSFNKINVDRYIDHSYAEMKFLLSDDIERLIWKSWNGTKWVETSSITLATAMSIETLLALTPTQLNLLTKGGLYIAAVMKSSDPYKTPVLRNVEFFYDTGASDSYYKMIDTDSIDLRYSKSSNEMTVVNNTSGDKKLKLVLL